MGGVRFSSCELDVACEFSHLDSEISESLGELGDDLLRQRFQRGNIHSFVVRELGEEVVFMRCADPRDLRGQSVSRVLGDDDVVREPHRHAIELASSRWRAGHD